MTQAIIVKREGSYVVTAAGAEVVASLLAQARAVSGDVATIIENIDSITDVAANIPTINDVAGNETNINAVAAVAGELPTIVAGLTGAELAAIRRANQQVERNRLADLVASISYFASKASGSDTQPGRAMSRAKLTVAGLDAAYESYGLKTFTIVSGGSGGTEGTYRAVLTGGTPYRQPYVSLRVNASGVLSTGINGWQKILDAGDYAQGSATPTIAPPPAANLGGTISMSVTLGFVPMRGDVIGFEHGGRWTEQMVVRTPGVTVCSYPKGGATRLPLFDCTDPVGAWTLDSGNVWSTVVGRAPDYEPVGQEDNYSLWEDTAPSDPGAGYRWMTRVTSKALCESTPDSYFIAAGTDAAINPTATVYVHAAGSVDPNTKAYRYNRRTQGVLGYQRLNNMTIDGVSCVGPLSAQGSINAGTNLLARRLCLANGGKHDLVFESGVIEDAVTWNTELVSNRDKANPGAGYDCIQITLYRDNPTGLRGELRRCFFMQPPGVQNAGFFFSHASGAFNYDENILEAIGSNNGGAVKGAFSKRQIYRAMYQTDLRQTSVNPGVTRTGEYTHFEQTHSLLVGVASGAMTQLLSSGITATGNTYIDDMTAAVFRNNVGYLPSTEALGSGTFAALCSSAKQHIDFQSNACFRNGRGPFIGSGNFDVSAGSPGLKRNIFVSNIANIGSFVLWLNYAANFNPATDYNVYIDLQANTNLRWRKGASNLAFAAWQALGYDTNSVVLNAAQADDLFLNGVAGLASGDWRLNPECALTFVDGSPIVASAGVQEYYDWNARQYVVGQPPRYPVVPSNWAECQAYAFDPTGWDFYP